MRVLFVYSLYDVNSRRRPLRGPDQLQFGISYISALLKQHGYETSLVVLGRPLGKRNRVIIERRLAEFRPHVVCFTAVSTEYTFIEEVARYVTSLHASALLVIGGPHVTLNACDEMLETFDALCIGEGEYPTLELIDQLARGRRPSGIPNLWIRNGESIEKNSTRPFVDDLDQLPLPDREMWTEWTEFHPDSVYPVLLGRGCPFECTYCSNHALRTVSSGPYVRMRSPENIVAEVGALKHADPSIREVYLEAESFVTHANGRSGVGNLKWATSVCEALEEFNATLDEPMSFGVNLRVMPNVDTDPLFEACRRCGVSFVNIGLELGSERVRREVLKRDYSNDDIRRAVRSARQHGIRPVLYNMVGLPGETPADHRETVRMNRDCEPDWYYLDIFYPYPGTVLYDHCLENGWIPERLDTRMERSRAIMDLPGFSRRQIQKCYTWFDYHVHRGRKPLTKILPHVAARKLKSYAGPFFMYRRLTRHGPLRRLKLRAKRG